MRNSNFAIVVNSKFSFIFIIESPSYLPETEVRWAFLILQIELVNPRRHPDWHGKKNPALFKY